MLRVIDESGEDYLFPAANFVIAPLPASDEDAVLRATRWKKHYRRPDSSPSSRLLMTGSGPESPEAIAAIKAPVYGFYAGNDARIGATVPKTQELMKAAGKSYEVVTYEGAGHGFMRAGEAPDATPANKKARDDAWTRWKSLLK